MERVTDTCCCFCLSAGLLAGLYKLLPPEPAFPWAFWLFPALFLLLSALWSRRLLFGLLALAAVVALIYWRQLPAWRQLALDFLTWWRAGFAPDIPAFSYTYYLLLHLLLAFAMSLSLRLLIHMRPPPLLLLIACPAELIALSVYGYGGHDLSILLLTAGLLPLLAAGSVERQTEARGQAAAMALTLTALALAIVFATLPADTTPLRWQRLGDKVTELRQNAEVRYRTWQQRGVALSSFDLNPEYHAELGGPIAADSTRMLLVQTTTTRLLLKGSVYDCYSGHGWSKNSVFYSSPANQVKYNPNAISDTAFPFVPGQNLSELNQALGQMPAPGSAHPLLPFTRQVTATVTLLHPLEPRLFYSGRLTDFSSEADIEPFFELYSELKSALPLANGYSYEFTSLMLDRTRPGFSAAVKQFSTEQNPGAQSLASLNSTEISLYRQLPMPLLVHQDFAATQQLVQDIVNAGLKPGEQRCPYEQAVLLERWLKENCRYTLTPEPPPQDRDFVLHFLDTREGYCSYYATAMVVMSRILGIRARYVTGYTLLPLRGNGQYEATAGSAHAWAELFFDNVGWLAFDPTGQADYTEALLSPTDPNREREILDPGQALTELPNPLPRLDYVQLGLWALGLLALAALALALKLRQRRQAFALPRLLGKTAAADILELYYGRLMRQIYLLGWQRSPAETILVFTRRMSAYLPAHGQQLRQLGAAISSLRYGAVEPAQAELINAEALYQQFEAMLRGQLKGWRYLRYRLRDK